MHCTGLRPPGHSFRPKTEADQLPGLPRRKSIECSTSTVNSLALSGAPCDSTFPVWRTRAASCPSFRGICLGTLPRNAEPRILTTLQRPRKPPPRPTVNGRRTPGKTKGRLSPPLHSCRPVPEHRTAGTYLVILETTPAPTVRPPSRIAKRRPSSIATGLIRVTAILTLSPGITISTPSGSSTAPVMSVVRK